MKSKPKLWNDLTENQILQLTSNLSAGLPGGNTRDWMAVARYWQEQHDKLCIEAWDMRRRVLRLALDLNE